MPWDDNKVLSSWLLELELPRLCQAFKNKLLLSIVENSPKRALYQATQSADCEFLSGIFVTSSEFIYYASKFTFTPYSFAPLAGKLEKGSIVIGAL